MAIVIINALQLFDAECASNGLGLTCLMIQESIHANST